MRYLRLFESFLRSDIIDLVLNIDDICQSFVEDYGDNNSHILVYLLENESLIENPDSQRIRNFGKNATWFSFSNGNLFLSGSENRKIEDFFYYDENNNVRTNSPSIDECSSLFYDLNIKFKSIIIQITICKDSDLYDEVEYSKISYYSNIIDNLIKRIYIDFDFKIDRIEDDPRGFYIQSKLEFI